MIALAFVALALAHPAPTVRSYFTAPQWRAVHGLIRVDGSIRNPTIQHHLTDLALMPARDLQALRDHGFHGWVLSVKPITSEIPHTLGPLPADYPAGTIPAGMYLPSLRTVYLGGPDHSFTPSLMLHETGHALGDLLGWDTLPALQTADLRLYSRLPEHVQIGGPGSIPSCDELLAEGIAASLTGADFQHNTYYDPAFGQLVDGLLHG